VEFTLNMETILMLITTLWVGTLTYIWFRHVQLDDERYQRVEARMDDTAKRIEVAMKEISHYQTEFNLKVATDIADIKSDVRKLLNGRS